MPLAPAHDVGRPAGGGRTGATRSRPTLVRQVIDQLREQVTSGEWPVGTRIPTEPQLVEALGVGRNTVREAVRALVHAGVLECRQGSGTYVISADEMTGAVRRRLAGAEAAEAVEVRRAFEVEAARLAAMRRTEDDLAVLDRALADREAAWRSGRVDDFVEADAVLHTAIVAASHNRMLTELYASFANTMLRPSIATYVGDELRPDHRVDHDRLVNAIREGDPVKAAAEAGAFLEV